MNEIGDDGVGEIQAPGNVTNALDGGYPVDNRDNADDSLQRIGATMGKNMVSCPVDRMVTWNGRIYGVSYFFLPAYASPYPQT